MTELFASVYIIDIPYAIDKEYTYRVPTELCEKLCAGDFVRVPFGNSNKIMSAVVTGFKNSCDYTRIKTIDSILDYPVRLSGHLASLCVFLKSRCFCSFGSAMKCILPPGINLGTSVYYTADMDDIPSGYNMISEVLFRYIKTKKKAYEKDIIAEYGTDAVKLLAVLCGEGIISKHSEVAEKYNKKNNICYRLAVPDDKVDMILESDDITVRQKELISFISVYGGVTAAEAENGGGFSAALISKLVKLGYVEKYEKRVEREAKHLFLPASEEEVILNTEQQSALERINALLRSGSPSAALLYGVTGSGKTRVIVEAVRSVLSLGKSAIILIPEIGLSSQAAGIYRAAFGDEIELVHSMLSAGERIDAYRRIADGKKRVVVGTRSAVFAPCENLGIIVIDEEQDYAYKSELTPKYHARDVARFRCADANALMLLSSATPSIESFYKAEQGTYELIRLQSRYGGAALPEIIIEDIRGESRGEGDLLGKTLSAALTDTIERNKQAILFVNRRGFNSFLSCHECGNVFICPNCSVSLTYHTKAKTETRRDHLSCHYCGYIAVTPERCEVCGGGHIGYHGFGTQKLQKELEEKFPEARLIRMDTDTTSAKHSHENMLSSFARREADILFGTQMISKGLDFPEVSLVGVISADTLLYMNDFRAGERTYSLLTQLSGRAGRADTDGKAIIQTYNPDNEILKYAKMQDYELFYESEIKLRKAVLFPPFCAITSLEISGTEEETVWEQANKFKAEISELHNRAHQSVKVIMYGPFREGIYKISGRYRVKIILKHGDNGAARSFLEAAMNEVSKKPAQTVKISIDYNPSVV